MFLFVYLFILIYLEWRWGTSRGFLAQLIPSRKLGPKIKADVYLAEQKVLLDWGPRGTGFPGPDFKSYFNDDIHKDVQRIIFSAGRQ